jgi:hypothetical protein
MKPSTGMLCRMSSAGTSTRSADLLFAAQDPYPTANTSESTYAASPRDSERNA